MFQQTACRENYAFHTSITPHVLEGRRLRCDRFSDNWPVSQYHNIVNRKNNQRSSSSGPRFTGNLRPINKTDLLGSELALELRTANAQSTALSNSLWFIREEKKAGTQTEVARPAGISKCLYNKRNAHNMENEILD